MFKKTVVKLTIFYSFLFFLIFWGLSLGLYAYLVRSFQSGYATKVKQRIEHHISGGAEFTTIRTFFIERDNTILDKSKEVALENFRKGLLWINAILLFLIPTVSWTLVYKMLHPIKETVNKQKQFVSDASHELRTPLAIMNNEIEVTLQQEREPHYYKKTLNTLKEEVTRLSQLVTNLLTLARQEDSIQQMETQSIEIVDLISKVVESFSNRFKEKDISCKVEFPEENCIIKGNSSMLEQLFANLIDNAIKFSNPQTTVTITIKKDKKYVRVYVKDEGIGIPKEYHKKIFDRFYRIDTSRTQTKGYGLGLSIVEKIVRIHRGNISFDSTPNKGTTFIVSLPIKS